MMIKRLHRDEKGFALVTAMVLMAVMAVLMVIALSAGNSAFHLAERGARFTRTLGIAEAGVNEAITRLGQNRTSGSPCPLGTAFVCSTEGGEYQVSWTNPTLSKTVITATGYLPSKASAQLTRQVQVTLEPEPQFQYALFSADTLEIKNNQVVVGDIFSNAAVTIGSNAIVCGSILNASGGVVTQNGAEIVKAYGTCTGKDGRVWTGGKIDLGSTGRIEGNATASAPSGQTCPPTPNTLYSIEGGTVLGQATACGRITATTTGALPNTQTDPPAAGSLPSFTFDPQNYGSALTCFPGSGTCGPDNTSATAVSQFNGSVSKSGMSGVYGIWQTQPTQATAVNLEGLSLSGDLTIITNAPITLGNTSTITSTVPATLVLVSLYIPPTGTTCSSEGGDCSIYGKNSVIFDSGDPDDPDDGVAGLLYTPGKMAFKNQANAAEGALYAGGMDVKNGFDIVYNSRIERVLGFGDSLEPSLWLELAV